MRVHRETGQRGSATEDRVTPLSHTLRIEARFKNARLYNAIAANSVVLAQSAQAQAVQRAGPVKSFCDMHDLRLENVYGLLNLRIKPMRRFRRGWRIHPTCIKLSAVLEHSVTYLFPADLYRITWPLVVAANVDPSRFLPLTATREYLTLPPTQDAEVMRSELHAKIREVLHTLTPREEHVLLARFGLDGTDGTLADIGETLGLTKERVRQIELKALQKLRHSPRSQVLRPYLGQGMKG